YYAYDLKSDGDGTAITSFNITKAAGLGGRVIPFDARSVAHYSEERGFFSNEVNFISTNDSNFQWIAGLYAYQQNFSQPITFNEYRNPSAALLNPVLQVQACPANTFCALNPNAFVSAAPNPKGYTSYINDIGLNNSYGVFLQGDWQFADTLKATVG